MTEKYEILHKTENAAKTIWSDVKKSAENFKEKMRTHHRRAIDEIELADADFYEDNIYDDPEYWRSTQYFSKNFEKSKIKH